MAALEYLPKYGDTLAIFVLGGGYDELKRVFDKLSVDARKDRFQELHDMPFGVHGQFFDKYGYHRIFKGDKGKQS